MASPITRLFGFQIICPTASLALALLPRLISCNGSNPSHILRIRKRGLIDGGITNPTTPPIGQSPEAIR